MPAKTKSKKSGKVYVGYLVTWTEYESGWGCRPDGASLHLTQDDVKKFIKKYWDGMPKEVPYEYSKANSDNGTLVIISKKLHDQLKRKESLRWWQYELHDLYNKGEISK